MVTKGLAAACPEGLCCQRTECSVPMVANGEEGKRGHGRWGAWEVAGKKGVWAGRAATCRQQHENVQTATYNPTDMYGA